MKVWVSWNKHIERSNYYYPIMAETKPKKVKVDGFARFYQMTTDNYNRIESAIAIKLGVKEGECIEFNIERVEA
jgi:hypothetical protein